MDLNAKIASTLVGLSMLSGGAVLAPDATIESTLVNKTFTEQANIKSALLVEMNPVQLYQDTKYGTTTISIESIKKIEGGVEIFARAWRNGKRVGFGSDGTVEIERFHIYNPPYKASDGTTRIDTVTLPSGKQKELVVDNLIEDPVAAIKRDLAHTIHVVAKDDKKIVTGKVGNTTSTFTPPSSGFSKGVDAAHPTWAEVHDATTAETSYSTGNNLFTYCGKRATVYECYRVFTNFDSSALGDTDTISSATISYYGAGPYGVNRSVNVYGSTASVPIVNDDFDAVDTVAQSDTAIALADWGTGAYEDFVLNATGIGNVSKTGTTKFVLRDVTKDVANVTPTDDAGIQGNWDTSGQEPKLVVVHTAAAAASSPVNGENIIF